jgi:glycosyltransferase involved in cell wall biosynthesis
MSKKSIWIINQYASTPDTGLGGRHYYLAKELAKLGHDVHLIAGSYSHLLKSPPGVSDAYTFEKIDGFKMVWVGVSAYHNAHSKKRIWNWLNFSWKVRKLRSLIDAPPDVVIASSPQPFAFLAAKYLSKKTGAKLVFEVRDIWPLTLIEMLGASRFNPFIALMQWVEDKAYRESDIVVSNLKNSVDHMVKRGMAVEKFVWIPNGVCLAEMESVDKAPREITAMIPSDDFVIGYTGTLGEANAIHALIEAALILKHDSHIKFVLVGDGKEKSAVEKLIESYGLENIVLLPPVAKTQVPDVLSRFDVCYIGLLDKPIFRFGVSPNKLFEYFYSSKPICYAIDSGDYQPVTESSSGVVVAPESPSDIARAIKELSLLSEEERSTMGDNGKRYVLDNHQYSHLAKLLEKTIFSVD